MDSRFVDLQQWIEANGRYRKRLITVLYKSSGQVSDITCRCLRSQLADRCSGTAMEFCRGLGERMKAKA